MNPVTLSYSQFINLRSPDYEQPQQSISYKNKKTKQFYIPKSFQQRKKSKTLYQKNNNNNKNQQSVKLSNYNSSVLPKQTVQSNLLQSALFHIQRKAVQYQLVQQQLSNNMSSFGFSRQATPINPLIGNTNLVMKQTKKRKNRPLHSVHSQLFQIDQQRDGLQEQQNKKQIILEDKLLGQIQAVYQYIFGKQRKMNPATYVTWKTCLLHEDKTSILGQNIPYSHPRIFPIIQVEKGFEQFYGQGKSRILYPGQQAIIIETISKYLANCTNNPRKFGRKANDIISQILQQCKLSKLQENPYCLKQIQTHFLLMATKWRYSGKLDIKDKTLESYLIMGKGNILDLKKDNILTRFLKGNKDKN